MDEEPERSRRARRAAEAALVRVVHHYGTRPEFVVLGGLVPEILCAGSDAVHAGTTDVDVQVDLEIACGAVNTKRLEQALQNAEFSADDERVWRWKSEDSDIRALVKFELLADLDTAPDGATVSFNECENLGAANLRGTGFASKDVKQHKLRARVGDDWRDVEVNVTGLAGFLLAKAAAARGRSKAKDWYDIAFVLKHNDEGGPEAAADAVIRTFGPVPISSVLDLGTLRSNFTGADSPGAQAFSEQMLIDNPDHGDDAQHRADSIIIVDAFVSRVLDAQKP